MHQFLLNMLPAIDQTNDSVLCAGRAQWLPGDLWHLATLKDSELIMMSLLQELIDRTMARLRAAVDACHVPNWPHAVTAVLPSAAAFARRRFGRTLRLLSSIVALQAVLDPRWDRTHPCRVLCSQCMLHCTPRLVHAYQ